MTSTVRLTASPSGSAGLAARTSVQAKVLDAPTAGLSGRISGGGLKIRTQAFVAMPLTGRALTTARLAAGAFASAALTSTAKVTANARAGFSGALALTGRINTTLQWVAGMTATAALGPQVGMSQGFLFHPGAGPTWELRQRQAFPPVVTSTTAALFGSALIALMIKAPFSGTLTLTARTSATARTRAGFSGALALAARTSVITRPRTGFSGAVSLVARTISQVKLQASNPIAIALVSATIIAVKARVAFSGVISLAGNTAVKVKAQAPNPIAVALLGATIAMVKLRGAVGGTLTLTARTAAKVAGQTPLLLSLQLTGRISGGGLKVRSAVAATAALAATMRSTVRMTSLGTMLAALTGRISGGGLKVAAGLTAFKFLTGRITVAAKASLARATPFIMLTAVTRAAFQLRTAVSALITQLFFNPRFVTTPILRTITTTGATRNYAATARLTFTMPQSPDFSPIDIGEIVTGTFDFGPWIAPNQSIAVIQSVACVVAPSSTVVDPTPGARIIGGSQLTISPQTSLANQALLQQWGNMVAGVTYRITTTIMTTDNQVLIMWAHQLCKAPD